MGLNLGYLANLTNGLMGGPKGSALILVFLVRLAWDCWEFNVG